MTITTAVLFSCLACVGGLRISRDLNAGPRGVSPIDQSLENEVAAGFPLRKSIDLKHLPMKYPEDACKADVIVGMLHTGLGSKMKHVMNQFGLASYGGFSFALGGKTNFMAEWKELFNQTVPICESAGSSGTSQSGTAGQFDAKALKFNEELKKKDPAYFADFRRAVFQKFFALNDQAQRRVTERLQEIGYPDDNQVIAVHIRRGDKRKEATPVPNEKYSDKIIESISIQQNAHYVSTAHTIKHIIEEHGKNGTSIKKVFIGCDDSDVKHAMTKLLGETYEVIGFKSQEWGGSKASAKSYGNHDYMYSVLTDVEAFRRSALFIGTGSSGLSHLAYFLRNGNQPSASMDEDWLARLG